ncbi:MAG: hypothetical protein ACLFTH_04205 [Candidatus Woesearchaeota archaeon]
MKFVTCVIPNWFTISEIGIQALFVIVTLLIAYNAYKVYRISGHRSSLLYGAGFLGLGVGYFMQALLHIFLFFGVSSKDILAVASQQATVTSTVQLSAIPTVLGMVATIAGLATIAYVTLKEKNPKVLILLIVLGMVSITTPYYPVTYHLAASIFLGFITIQYFKHHERKRNAQSMAVYLGFGFILLGTLQLALSDVMSTFYILGHFVALIGYLLLLWSLMKVVSK